MTNLFKNFYYQLQLGFHNMTNQYFIENNKVFEKQHGLYPETNNMNKLINGYVKLYNLKPILDDDYGVFPVVEWENPNDPNTTYNISEIMSYIEEMEDFEIKQLMNMQEDLHFGIGRKRKKSSIGIHDLDKISFPLLYTATNKNHEFTPLHSEKILSISEIITDTQTGKDYGNLLGQSSQVPIIIDSNKKTSNYFLNKYLVIKIPVELFSLPENTPDVTSYNSQPSEVSS